MIDSEGVIRYISPSVQRVLGYKPEELIGRLSIEVVHPDDLPEVARGFEKALQKPGVPLITVCRAKHKDGTWRVIEGTGVNQLDNPAVKGFISNMRDITERKKAEEALTESEEKYRTFLETANDLIHIVDKDGNFTYVNPSMARTLGYSSEEMIGMQVTQIFSGESLKGFPLRMKKIIKQGRITCEDSWVTKEGKAIRGEINVAAIYDKYGKYAGARGITRDITERKRAKERLERSFVDLAETVSRAMGSRDPYTAGHQRRVAELARLVGKKMGLD